MTKKHDFLEAYLLKIEQSSNTTEYSDVLYLCDKYNTEYSPCCIKAIRFFYFNNSRTLDKSQRIISEKYFHILCSTLEKFIKTHRINFEVVKELIYCLSWNYSNLNITSTFKVKLLAKRFKLILLYYLAVNGISENLINLSLD